jgi:hypothetical protein
MKNLLFLSAAALLLVESSTVAFAIGDSVFTRTDKWSGSAQREVWGPPVPPAAYPRGYPYTPGYNYSYGYSPDQSGGDVGHCMRFRSYDPRSGTYLGFDGLRHPCKLPQR